MNLISIASRTVGPGWPSFIIAEAGVNHNGVPELARKLVDAAVEANTDAVKFQTFCARRLAGPDAPKADYQIETTGSEESQLEMLERLELSPQAHRDLMAYCEQKGILFLSTPFDQQSADLLEELGLPAFKIPSGEITNLPFLAHVAAKGKPMIVSTGMSDMDEVAAAVEVIRAAGNDELVLLHCVSNYPADPADANLRAMASLSARFDVPVGFSDHTLGIEIALAAVALGACVIEKHFTLDRNMEGPDHRASLEPDELSAMVLAIRKVESALGDGDKRPAAGEGATARMARKSLVAARDIRAGEVLQADMIAVTRPGTGMPASMLERVIGRTLACDVSAGTVLREEMLS